MWMWPWNCKQGEATRLWCLRSEQWKHKRRHGGRSSATTTVDSSSSCLARLPPPLADKLGSSRKRSLASDLEYERGSYILSGRYTDTKKIVFPYSIADFEIHLGTSVSSNTAKKSSDLSKYLQVKSKHSRINPWLSFLQNVF